MGDREHLDVVRVQINHAYHKWVSKNLGRIVLPSYSMTKSCHVVHFLVTGLESMAHGHGWLLPALLAPATVCCFEEHAAYEFMRYRRRKVSRRFRAKCAVVPTFRWQPTPAPIENGLQLWRSARGCVLLTPAPLAAGRGQDARAAADGFGAAGEAGGALLGVYNDIRSY